MELGGIGWNWMERLKAKRQRIKWCDWVRPSVTSSGDCGLAGAAREAGVSEPEARDESGRM